MNTLEGLLAGIVAEPLEETRWLVLADYLDEYGDPHCGELLRLHRQLLATCLEPGGRRKRAAWQKRIVELLCAGVSPCVPRQTVMLPGGVELALAFVPPGAFLMGSDHPDADADEKVKHVTLTQGFFLGIHQVTQAQWKAVMGTEPSRFKGPDRPVERVSWDDCQEFLEELNEVEKGQGYVYRLPTEAEWEYACRAGTTTEYWSGDDEAALKRVGWYGENSGNETHPVGRLAANPWGLYDVHGNVWEWTDSLYEEGASFRVNRGGSWFYTGEYCQAANRDTAPPSDRSGDLGLRLARVPSAPG
ncbi:MAG: SUMF1/EgtB/PvdO family nonheme iron enzyme, partial [Gemmata sp.]